MAVPAIGSRWTYDPGHGQGFGESHLGSPLTAEMTELDLKPGKNVTVIDINEEDGGRIHAEWVDDVNLDRITSFDPDEFAADFIAN